MTDTKPNPTANLPIVERALLDLAERFPLAHAKLDGRVNASSTRYAYRESAQDGNAAVWFVLDVAELAKLERWLSEGMHRWHEAWLAHAKMTALDEGVGVALYGDTREPRRLGMIVDAGGDEVPNGYVLVAWRRSMTFEDAANLELH